MSNASEEPRSDSADDSGGDEAVEHAPGRIDDDQLPEDLQPTDDNPLAKAPDEGDQQDPNSADASG